MHSFLLSFFLLFHSYIICASNIFVHRQQPSRNTISCVKCIQQKCVMEIVVISLSIVPVNGYIDTHTQHIAIIATTKVLKNKNSSNIKHKDCDNMWRFALRLAEEWWRYEFEKEKERWREKQTHFFLYTAWRQVLKNTSDKLCNNDILIWLKGWWCL